MKVELEKQNTQVSEMVLSVSKTMSALQHFSEEQNIHHVNFLIKTFFQIFSIWSQSYLKSFLRWSILERENITAMTSGI